MTRIPRGRCYCPIENQVVPMTYLVAKPYSPRGSGRGECSNNGRQALPSLVRPRFLPGDQKGPGPRDIGQWSAPTFLIKRGKRGFKPRSSKRTEQTNKAPIPKKQPRKWVRFFERPILYTD